MNSVEYVRLSNRSEGNDIYQLRLQAYLDSPEFTLVETEFLKWGPGDEEGLVLSAYNAEEKPIATISGCFLFEKESAEQIMRCSWNYQYAGQILFPALLLSKGATVKGLQNKGIHSVLRFYLIKAAINCSLNSVLGTVFETAPRTKLMKKIGYEFILPKEIWDLNLIIPNNQTLIGILEKTKFEYALSELEQVFGSAITNTTFNQKDLNERMNQLLTLQKNKKGA